MSIYAGLSYVNIWAVPASNILIAHAYGIYDPSWSASYCTYTLLYYSIYTNVLWACRPRQTGTNRTHAHLGCLVVALRRRVVLWSWRNYPPRAIDVCGARRLEQIFVLKKINSTHSFRHRNHRIIDGGGDGNDVAFPTTPCKSDSRVAG